MPAGIEEPPVTTSSLPSKPSFLASDDFNNSLEEALRKDGKMPAPTEPKQPDPKPVEQKPTDQKPNDQKPTDQGDDDVPADIKSPETQSSWKKLKGAMKAVEKERDTIRGERDTIRGERDAFKTELEELRKKAATPAQKRALEEEPEYQALKKSFEERNQELEQYSERLRLLDVEKHPKFVAYFKEKTDQQFAIAKELGGDKLVEALQLPAGEYRKEKLRDVVAEMDPIDQARLGSVINNLHAIESERASEIAKARESYEQIQAQEKLRSEQERESVTKSFDRVRAEVTDKEKGLSVFREKEGDAEWNKGVQERLAVAEYAFHGKLKPEDMARNAYWGAAAPQLLIELNGQIKRNQELEKTIAELRAADPNPGGGKGDDNTNNDNSKRGLEGIMDEIVKVMPGAR